MKNTFFILFIFCITQAIPAQTFTETHQIQCGDTVSISGLGYPTWNDPHILKKPAYGHALLLGDFVPPNSMQYISPPWFEGVDTVVVECAHATQITCDTGIYVFEIGCAESIAPVYVSEVACDDSVYVPNLSGWWAPQLIDSAQHGFAQVILEPTDGAGVFYRPDPGFEGLDYVRVQLYLGADTLLYLFQVYCDLMTTQNEVRIEPLEVFPNPAKESLYIRNSGVIDAIQIVDAQGRSFSAILEKTESIYRLDISRLPAGFYFIKTKTAAGVNFAGRFVKN
jgi:hypothetical protein